MDMGLCIPGTMGMSFGSFLVVDVDDGRDDALGSATSDAVRTNRDQSTGATPHSASRRVCCLGSTGVVAFVVAGVFGDSG